MTSLSVEHAADVCFLVLSLAGLYIGFEYGFVRGLSRNERLLMAVFALYPAVAIVSYLAGMQSNPGFRLLGRDLRFLLFIPVYLALRRSPPRRETAGWALAAGAAAAFVTAAVEVLRHGEGFRARGVAGVAISFGDLALIAGFVGAALLLGLRSRRALIGAGLPVACALGASVLSGSRGGWIALPFMGLGLIAVGRRASIRWAISSAMLLLAAALGVLAVVPGTPVSVRGREALRDARLYWKHVDSRKLAAENRFAVCANDRAFLSGLLDGIREWHGGARVPVRVVRDAKAFRGTDWRRRCRSDYLLTASNPRTSRGWVTIVIPRSVAGRTSRPVAVLAQGKGLLRSADARVRIRIDNERLKVVRAYLRLPEYQQLLITLLPGDSLNFVPLQLDPGEYYYGFAENSLALRLEMWRLSLRMFLERPLVGQGTGAYQAYASGSPVRHDFAPGIAGFEHPHSDYFAALGEEGLLGLLALAGVLIGPLLFVRSAGGGRSGVAWVLVMGIGACGLTETMFVHSLVITWYVTVTAIVAAVETGEASECPSAEGGGAKGG